MITTQDIQIIQAVPGAGKTTELLRIIAEAITMRDVPAEDIYAITFTQEAAAELRNRLDASMTGVHVSTIHSLAYSILSEDERNNIPHSSSFYNSILLQATRSVYQGALHARILAVDEAQDLSVMEYDFIMGLLKHIDELYIFGDPMQSIFSFRGAAPRYMNDFSGTITTFATTYRFGQTIADSINKMFPETTAISSLRSGGEVGVQIISYDDIYQTINATASDAATILFRTNYELLNYARTCPLGTIDYRVPLSLHPHVASTIAVYQAKNDYTISVDFLQTAIEFFGFGSYKTAQGFSILWEMQRSGSRITRELLYDMFIDHSKVTMFILPNVQNAMMNAIHAFLTLCDTIIPTRAEAIYDHLQREYRVDRFWDIPPEVLLVAIQRYIMTESDMYYNVQNNALKTAMTIHAAKGHEFNHVILPVHLRGNINIYDEEEQRILYVACSRAREKLDIILPVIGYTYDRDRENIINRILAGTNMV